MADCIGIAQVANLSPCEPMLTVVVPFFNESRTILDLLEQVYLETTLKEIIVVNDGSSDGSGELVDAWISRLGELNDHTTRVTHVSHDKNRGKGRAVRTGLEHALGRYFLVQDADLELSPTSYPRLLAPLIQNESQIVLGKRIGSGQPTRRVQTMGISLINLAIQFLYGYRVSDAACCFKVTRTSTIRLMNLQCEGFEFCPEFLAKAGKLGLTLCEVEVGYNPRSFNEGKKLRVVRDGCYVFVTLLRYCRWTPAAPGLKTLPAANMPSAKD